MASYNEIFGYGQSLTPTPFPMTGEEIVDPWPQYEAYHDMDYGYYNNHTNRYNGQVQYEGQPQFYFGEHDNRRNHDHNNRGNYTRNPIPFRMDREELSPSQISVPIYLSNPRDININGLRSALSQHHEMSCNLVGNVLTVTGFPSTRGFGVANEFLSIVKELTGDYGAYVAR